MIKQAAAPLTSQTPRPYARSPSTDNSSGLRVQPCPAGTVSRCTLNSVSGWPRETSSEILPRPWSISCSSNPLPRWLRMQSKKSRECADTSRPRTRFVLGSSSRSDFGSTTISPASPVSTEPSSLTNSAVVSGITPQASDSGVTFAPVVETAKAAVAVLQEAGADVIVALTHLGIAEDRQLVREVKGIHLVLGGHDHDPITFRSDAKVSAFDGFADAVANH